jgi:hypothetical protein
MFVGQAYGAMEAVSQQTQSLRIIPDPTSPIPPLSSLHHNYTHLRPLANLYLHSNISPKIFVFSPTSDPGNVRQLLVQRGTEIEKYGHRWLLGLLELGECGITLNYFLRDLEKVVFLVMFRRDVVPECMWGKARLAWKRDVEEVVGNLEGYVAIQ